MKQANCQSAVCLQLSMTYCPSGAWTWKRSSARGVLGRRDLRPQNEGRAVTRSSPTLIQASPRSQAEDSVGPVWRNTARRLLSPKTEFLWDISVWRCLENTSSMLSENASASCASGQTLG